MARELDRLAAAAARWAPLGGFGHYCVARALTYASANLIAPLNYTQMIGSVIVGYLMFAEVPDFYTWLGTALIIGAGLLVGHGRAAQKKSEGGNNAVSRRRRPADRARRPRFRALLERPGILQMPGTHNGMAALQAKAAGFEALYLSGAAMSASMGLPDLGVITVDEVCFFIRQVARASGLPVLVDGDTGYGEALNVMHMVRAFEEAGAGAVHIEDQILPKKCGHLNNKKLADPHDMAAKVAAAAKARRDLCHRRPHRRARRAKASTAPWRAPSATSRRAPTRSSPRR